MLRRLTWIVLLAMLTAGCGSKAAVTPPENPVPPLDTSKRVTISGGGGEHRAKIPNPNDPSAP